VRAAACERAAEWDAAANESARARSCGQFLPSDFPRRAPLICLSAYNDASLLGTNYTRPNPAKQTADLIIAPRRAINLSRATDDRWVAPNQEETRARWLAGFLADWLAGRSHSLKTGIPNNPIASGKAR